MVLGMTRAANEPTRTVLPDADRTTLAERVRAQGIARVAATIGVHPQTLNRLVAGFAGHRSVVALVERRLIELAAEEG